MTIKVAYFLSHPIQYQAPLLRLIHKNTDLNLQVFYENDFSISNFYDPGFKQKIFWDNDLLGGYCSKFLIKKMKWLQTLAYLINFKPDIIWLHGYTKTFSIFLILIASFFNIKLIARGESNLHCQTSGKLRHFFRKLFFKTLAKRIDAFLYIGSLNKEFYQYYKIPNHKLFFCPYTIDNAHFEQILDIEQKNILLKKLQLDVSLPILLFASKLQPRKCVLDLIKAYKSTELKKRCSLIIIGQGEQYQQALSITQDMNNVRVLGFKNQSELPAYYSIADVFILPSAKEPWGLAINEAMSAGCAILASNQVGAAYDLIKDNGMIFQQGNINDMIYKLLSILNQIDNMKAQSKKIIKNWSYQQSIDGLLLATNTISQGHSAWQNQKS